MKVAFIVFFVFISAILTANNISGYITDSQSGEVLIGANVYIELEKTGTVTNSYGYYSLTANKGTYQLRFSSVGYINQTIKVDVLQNDITLNIELKPATQLLEDIIITDKNQENTKRAEEFHVQKINQQTLTNLPMIFGEPDVIKAIQYMSGVKNTADGSNGLYVRGGSSDENLILIDEAPVYNPSHIFGLISVFNPGAINDVTFYKGIIPADFGGRLSSVISTQLKEGNSKKATYNAGISPFALRFTAQGPIIKNKISYFVSGRSSYFDKFLQPDELFAFIPSFYDLNAKINIKFSARKRLFLSLYKGHDRLMSYDGLNNDWGNLTTTLRYNFNPAPRFFTNLSVIYSKYTNNYKFSDSLRHYQLLSSIESITGKAQLSYYPNDQIKIYTGIQSTIYEFSPGKTDKKTEIIPQSNNSETAFYLSSSIRIMKRMEIIGGIRMSVFYSFGQNQWYEYKPDTIITHQNTQGIYSTHTGIAPRLNLAYKLNKNISIQAGAGRNYQYYQLLQNQVLPYSSLECWYPAGKTLLPQYADIATLGISSQFNNIKINSELYYKQYTNKVDFIDHAQLLNNAFVEKELRTGIGKAYGIETEINSTFQKIDITMSYNWSRTFLKIQEINNNNWYPTIYDIPHDVKITAGYQTAKRWSFNAAWIFMSGRAITIPTGYVSHNSRYIPIYSERNTGRLPNYHRLDVSARLMPKKQSKKIKGTLVLGIYNLYARQNPLGYQFAFNSSDASPKVYQYGFVRLFPNISYSVEF